MSYPRVSSFSGPCVDDLHSVAVVGLACRFSGDATDGERFWDLLCKARSTYAEPDRFNFKAFQGPSKGRLNTCTSDGGHFLRENVAAFDANFFNISQVEALAMDPQQRLMLEISFEAFEDAGLPLEKIAGTNTSCYVGNFTTDYRQTLFRDIEAAPLYSMSGTGSELISNRLSWFYDLRGPSFTLGTACSSSLVALHQGCQSLRTRESNMAIVGGSNLLLNPDMFQVLSNQQFLAKDGRCKTFDAKGDGYGRGEGFAAVILKRIDDAIRDGDSIRAVIRGSGINQDGKTKAITVPSAEAQAELIRSTYYHAGLDLMDTHYFEAHGTGTQAGDPLELEAISKAFGADRPSGRKLIVGSVKPNIGHLEATAGLAGLIKAIYIVEHAMIPPNVNFQQANPKIPFEKWGLTVPTVLTPWPVEGLRRVSINSFGYGGTNAHVVLDDAFHYLLARQSKGNNLAWLATATNLQNQSLFAPGWSHRSTQTTEDSSDGLSIQDQEARRLFFFSGHDKDGLNRQRQSYSKYLRNCVSRPVSPCRRRTYLRDLAFTLDEKRSRLAWQMCFAASSVKELLFNLESKDFEIPAFRKASSPRVGFIFNGQGAQWAKMGIELNQYPVFRESIEQSDEYLRSALGCSWSVVEEMSVDESQSNIDLPSYSQPICTALQIAIVDLLESWNIVPSVVTGHSSGEIAGAYCLGALTKEDALKAAYFRGQLSAEMKILSPSTTGGMLAVGAPESQARRYMSSVSCGSVVVACVNSPSSVTISGDALAISEMETMLKHENVFARKLKVETAYHSPHMEMISVLYLEAMKDMETQPERESRKMYSAVTGGPIEPSELGPVYWVRNLVSPVLFYHAVHDLVRPMRDGRRSTENAVDILLEIGPHSTLKDAVIQSMKKEGINGVDYRSVLSRRRNGIETALAAAGVLSAQGVPVDIRRVNNSTNVSFDDPPLQSLKDLPPYQWNHSRTFWAESRISKEHRFREYPCLSLLGAPCPTMGEGEKLWRGFMRISEEPWIRDHRIENSVLYPAAGFLAMAIEGASQVAARGQVIRDFRLRDVQLIAPAIVTEDSDLECILSLRPHLTSTRDNSSAWLEFTVSTCANGQNLRKNCLGLMLIDYQSGRDTGITLERGLADSASRHLYKEAEKECPINEDPADFYRRLASVGLNYGPTFQNISRIRKGMGRSCCDVDISNPSLNVMSERISGPHVIHPTNLDAMFHAVFAAFQDQRESLKQAMVPKSIDEIVISAEIPFAVGTQFKGVANASRHGFREFMADLVILDKGLNKSAVTVKGFCFAAISGANNNVDEENGPCARKLFSKLVWKPAVQLLSPYQMREALKTSNSMATTPTQIRKLENLDRVALICIRRSLNRVPITQVPTPHLKAMYRWMEESLERAHSGCLQVQEEDDANLDDKTSQLAQAEIGASGHDREAIEQIGRGLEQVLLGTLDAEQAACKEDAHGRPPTMPGGINECFDRVSELATLIAHEDPNISILEIGSATGCAAPSIFTSLYKDPNAVPQTFNYVYSTHNDSMMKKAKESLEPWMKSIKFKRIAIEQDLNSQGLTAFSFNIVIFSNPFGIHDPDTVLPAVRRLLQPNGKLCIVAFTNQELRPSLLLRCFPDWSSQNGYVLRCNRECVAVLNCHKLTPILMASDFADSLYQQPSLIIASVDTPQQDGAKIDEITILEVSNPSVASRSLATELASQLERKLIRTSIVPWKAEVCSWNAKNCISLLELDRTFIADLSAEDFAAMQRLILDSSSVLWVSTLDHPAGNLVSGMARSIRNEIPGCAFRTLLVQRKSLESPDNLAQQIGKLATNPTFDNEFMEENGLLKIPRVVEDTTMNVEMSNMLVEGKDKIEHVSREDVDSPLALAIRTQAMLDTLCLETDVAANDDIGADEVEIEVKATGLNFRDVMVAMGQIPDNLLGFEASGIITRVGQAVIQFRVGDSVCTLGHGAHRTLFKNKASLCQPIPVDLSFEEAATLPLVHCTAFYALVHIAMARAKQTILIHAAAGGVGQAVIQLARHFDMDIFATVGSADKKVLIQKTYGISEDHIFNSRDLSFASGVSRMTNGRGVDCVVNSLSGEALRQTWECIAPFGTFIEIGMKDILCNTELDMRPFLQDASFTFFNLKHVMSAKPELMAQILEGTFDFLRQGVTKPVSPVTAYPISQVENAFRVMQAGKHRGKIALTWACKDVVPVLRQASVSLKINPNATYLLVGGLGGLGRSLASLLADLGARHLCFISRSGDNSEDARRTIKMLKDRGVETNIYCCDVSNKESLTVALFQCSKSMPRISGVFQCAMVLRDTLFEKMSYSQWTESLRPKVQGSWNLHTLLPQVLDFFIILSSFAGIFGNRTQSNYAAAGAYQDALAFYRRSRGLKAVTIDLGIMRDVGVVAEQGATDYLKEWEEPFGIRESELHQLIRKIISSELSGSPDNSEPAPQILTGFATGETALAAGIRRPFYFDDARFSILAQTGLTAQGDEQPSAGSGGGSSLRKQLAHATDMAEAARAMTEAMLVRVAKSLQTDRSEIDPGRPLHSYGVDSLVAVEVANWVFKEVKVTVSVLEILTTMPISEFSQLIVAKSPLVPAAVEGE